MAYLLLMIPPVLLMFWAQHQVKSSFAAGLQIPARLSGAATARHILDSDGLSDVPVVEVRGRLSDHYDPRAREVRLSSDVYHGQTASSVGIAAHEVGHALQHAHSYGPLVLRNLAVPAAQFGGQAFTVLLMIGFMTGIMQLVILGVVLFGAVVLFQLINLPVEFDASHRAKRILPEMNILDADGTVAVNRVLNAAAMTYVAATLQSVMTFLFYFMRFAGSRR